MSRGLDTGHFFTAPSMLAGLGDPMSADPLAAIRALIARHWGFRSLRPLQEQAIRADLDRRDSLVVMPTGGGKSLCYQAPAAYPARTRRPSSSRRSSR